MDWTQVKVQARPFKTPKKHENDLFKPTKVVNTTNKNMGIGAVRPATNKQASAIAQFDPLRDSDEEIKYELVSHDCAEAIQKARMSKEWTQTQLAKACNEKVGLINDIEKGTATYNADVINRIERALGVKIPRGRNNKKKSRKRTY